MAKDLSSMAKNNKSYMAKPGEVESKWYIIDASDMILGRLASQVATILKGKNKPEFAVYKAVKGMLPKNSLGKDMLKKLRVYAGNEQNHQAQCPVELKLD